MAPVFAKGVQLKRKSFYAPGILALVLMLAVLGIAEAGTDSARRCQSAKLHAAGIASGAMLRCHALAARAGASVDPDCLDGARRTLAAAFATAERGECAITAEPDQNLAARSSRS